MAQVQTGAIGDGKAVLNSSEKTALVPPAVAAASGPASTGLNSAYALGTFFLVMSAVCQSFMSMSIHVAQVTFGLPVPAVFIVRTVISLAASVLYLVATSNVRRVFVPARAAVPLALYSFTSSGGALLLFYGLAYIPAGTAATLSSVAPILTSVLAAFIFHDPFTALHALALLLNIVGIYFVVTPADAAAAHSFHGQNTVLGVVFALAAACANTTNALSIKHMNGAVHPVVLILGYSVGCAALLPFTSDWHYVDYIRNNHRGLAFAVASAFFGFAKQVLIAMGLARVPAGVGVVTRTLNVPLVFVLALLFLGEQPTLLNVLGVLFVLGSVLGTNILNQTGYGRRRRPTVAEEQK